MAANAGSPKSLIARLSAGASSTSTALCVRLAVAGQYGHVRLRIEPLDPGTGYEFEDAIVGGVIPREYIPAVDKGVRGQLENGVIAGYPVRRCQGNAVRRLLS